MPGQVQFMNNKHPRFTPSTPYTAVRRYYTGGVNLIFKILNLRTFKSKKKIRVAAKLI